MCKSSSSINKYASKSGDFSERVYNRNIQYGIAQQNVIMHTCADCFHILDLVTFIRPLN